MAKASSKGSGKPIPRVEINLEISSKQGEELLNTLKVRFEDNMKRHYGLEWPTIQAKLEASPEKLPSLYAMESTGGEPDIVSIDSKSGEIKFFDCSKETPMRRNICYDREGEKEREKKGLFPGGNALDLAADMGIEILNESQYRELQKIGAFDTASSSWLRTPNKIRELGGALFGDRRYETVFIYHNGAQSFYGGRGFRGVLKV